jgi:hypothetical protein
MTENLPAPRRYTDREVRRLIERAAELQDTEPTATEASGLTLAELEDIAREAGIDPLAVRRAAAELATDSMGTTGDLATRLAGAPIRNVRGRVLPFEVDPARFQAAIPLIQDAADAPGQASLVGGTLTWRGGAESALRVLHVTLATRDGQTAIRIDERYTGLAGSLFGGITGGAGAGVGIGVGVGVGAALGSTLMMVGFPVAVIGLAYAGSRAMYSNIVGRRADTLERLLTDLADTLSAPGAGD